MIPPKTIRIEYASFHPVKLADGRIKEWWLLEDNLAFMMQLGMKMVPGDSAG